MQEYKRDKRINIGQRASKGRMMVILLFLFLLGINLMSCNKNDKYQLLIGAASSLEKAMVEIEELYSDQNPEVKINFTFAGSGTLEEQIREGAPIDVFIPAAQKQMDALEEDGFIMEDSREDLLTNDVVLIVPKNSELGISGFDTITKAKVIAIGDPESVPAGQYAKEIFEGLGIWDQVYSKASLGKNVTEVLSWVSTENADAGIVYRTDAALRDDVTIISQAPEESQIKAVYPAAVLNTSKNKKTAKSFIEFLNSEEAKQVFIKYGFGIVD